MSLISFLFLTQVRELAPLLGRGDSPSRLIWTSSRSARRANFSLEDFQHSRGREPYSSSKYALDLLSVALNRNFNQRVRRAPGRAGPEGADPGPRSLFSVAAERGSGVSSAGWP